MIALVYLQDNTLFSANGYACLFEYTSIAIVDVHYCEIKLENEQFLELIGILETLVELLGLHNAFFYSGQSLGVTHVTSFRSLS